MKVFVVFLAIMIIFCGLFIFESDMSRYMRLQKDLKLLAEDCAEAAALCIDEVRSSRTGKPVIDLDKGRKAALRLLDSSALLKPYGGKAEVTVSPEGDLRVSAEIKWNGPDIFRLSFIEVCSAHRKAAYEWK